MVAFTKIVCTVLGLTILAGVLISVGGVFVYKDLFKKEDAGRQ